MQKKLVTLLLVSVLIMGAVPASANNEQAISSITREDAAAVLDAVLPIVEHWERFDFLLLTETAGLLEGDILNIIVERYPNYEAAAQGFQPLSGFDEERMAETLAEFEGLEWLVRAVYELLRGIAWASAERTLPRPHELTADDLSVYHIRSLWVQSEASRILGRNNAEKFFDSDTYVIFSFAMWRSWHTALFDNRKFGENLTRLTEKHDDLIALMDFNLAYAIEQIYKNGEWTEDMLLVNELAGNSLQEVFAAHPEYLMRINAHLQEHYDFAEVLRREQAEFEKYFFILTHANVDHWHGNAHTAISGEEDLERRFSFQVESDARYSIGLGVFTNRLNIFYHNRMSSRVYFAFNFNAHFQDFTLDFSNIGIALVAEELAPYSRFGMSLNLENLLYGLDELSHIRGEVIIKCPYGLPIDGEFAFQWTAHDEGVIVEGPDAPAERISGRLTSEGNDERFLHGENHTIRIVEATHGAVSSPTEPASYEIRIVQPGVHIVDARLQVLGGNLFEMELVEFDGGPLRFTHESSPNDSENIYGLDIGLLLSVAAGFEQNHGGKIDAEIFRNNVHIGTVHIANITDPIILEAGTPSEYIRSHFNGQLLRVGTFEIIEAAPGVLEEGDELWFHVQASQNYRFVYIPHGLMSLWLTEPEINTDESGLTLELIPRGEGNPPRSFAGDGINPVGGFRVVQPSTDEPGRISFNEVYMSGPTVPGIDWHIVVTGESIASNSHRFFLGELNEFQERARIFDVGYNAVIHRILGAYVPRPPAEVDIPLPPPLHYSFTAATMVNVDGAYIQAVAFPTIAPGVVSAMMNPRVFADFIGMEVAWNENTRTITFGGYGARRIFQAVSLMLDSPIITINGQEYDIAVKAGQTALEGQISPVIIDGRAYVPVRVLAEIFGVPVEFEPGIVTLG